MEKDNIRPAVLRPYQFIIREDIVKRTIEHWVEFNKLREDCVIAKALKEKGINPGPCAKGLYKPRAKDSSLVS